MDSVKLDPQLGLALSLSDQERSRSEELELGYDSITNTWELIVQYVGSLDEAAGDLLLSIVYLSGDYAIVRIPESNIEELLKLRQIAYVEKPRMLVSEQTSDGNSRTNADQMTGYQVSCIPAVRREPYGLTGVGTLICVVDSGIDYFHPDFRNADGTTKIAGIWDQTIEGNPPEGFYLGSYFDREQINKALETGSRESGRQLVPSTDRSGHGTHVAGIAITIAPDANLLIVKLGTGKEQDVPRTTELIQAVTFARRYADAMNTPISINLSYGNNYGAHDGTALVERYLDSIAATARMSICVGTGNEGAASRHVSRRIPVPVQEDRRSYQVEWVVAPYETSLNLQIWKSFADDMEFSIVTPRGISVGPFGVNRMQQVGNQYIRYLTSGTKIEIYQGQPTPYNQSQQIFVALIPEGLYLDEGIWRLEIRPIQISGGSLELYLPVAEATSSTTGFLNPSVDGTLTIPSTASRVISVAAYNSLTMSQVAFSGRGFSGSDQVKPDLAAPGVDINAAAPGGGYSSRSGTSMATPFVTGAASLLMQWGIVDGNDPYLYGEKLRAYLTRGATRLPGFHTWPNPRLGWGILCVRNSIPM